MWKQIQLLTKIKLCNIGGLNQIRYSKNPKEKKKGMMMALMITVISFILILYSSGLAYGFVILGIPEVIPTYAMTIISLIILFFSIYKAGSLIFEMRTYEMLISLPLSPVSIVVSRFCMMYLQNVLLCAAILIPSSCVYGFYQKPGFLFCLCITAGILIIPFLPMTIAVAIGVVITAVSSRMKHKSLAAVILTLALTLGFLILSMTATANQEMFTNDIMRSLSVTLQSKLYQLYPPARLFTSGVLHHNFLAFAGFILLSILPFILLFYVIQQNFVSICSALNSKAATKNYQMKGIKQQELTAALYKKELARYFASSIYVINTIIGYLLMVLAAVSILVTGLDQFEEMFGFHGVITKVLPFILAALCSISPTTSSSISMEGRNWWQVQSLPIPAKELFDAKILVNLTIALPCYVLGEIILFAAVHVSPAERVGLIVIPLMYILLMSILGITINRKMPVFKWDTETAVVKSSASTFTTLVTGFLSVIIPALLLLVPGLSYTLIIGVITVLTGTAAVILYINNCRTDLRKIE